MKPSTQKRLLSLCIFLISLPACTNTSAAVATIPPIAPPPPSPIATAPPITTPTQYPIVPIPANVFYQGLYRAETETEVNFEADPSDYPTPSGAKSYPELLIQEGWVECPQSSCNLGQYWSATPTDTGFLGIYQYGSDPNPPTIIIGINAMIPSVQETILWVKNCGIITETHSRLTSTKAGCLILLPDKLQTLTP